MVLVLISGEGNNEKGNNEKKGIMKKGNNEKRERP